VTKNEIIILCVAAYVIIGVVITILAAYFRWFDAIPEGAVVFILLFWWLMIIYECVPKWLGRIWRKRYEARIRRDYQRRQKEINGR
jgi:hypothetical protein